MAPKHPTSVRMSEVARQYLSALALKWGVSQSAVLELLIREKAKAERLK